MCVGNEELVHPVVFFGGCGLLAPATAFLRAVFAQWLALDVAQVRQSHHHVGGCDQVFGAQVKRAVLNQAAARAQLGLAEFVFNDRELVANDGGNPLGPPQDVQQIVDLGHNFFVLDDDLVLLQTGQALQTHLQNFLRLGFRQAVEAVGAHAELFFQAIRAVIVGVDHAAVGACAGQHFAHQLAVPGLEHQLGLGHWRGGCVADDRNELVNIGQSHRQAFQHMTAFARFTQREHGAPRHHFAPV